MRNRCKRLCFWAGLSVCLIILGNAAALLAADVTLSWDAPTTNEDGSPLTDLAGYKIYYSLSSGNYTSHIDVGNVTTSQVNNLTDGATYYLAVTAYDFSGNESAYSSEVSKTIPSLPVPDIVVSDSVSPAGDHQVPFGDVTAGSMSQQTVTITNNGNADLVIGNIAQSDPVASPFSIINDYCSGRSISPSSHCTFMVRYSPSFSGSFYDSFDIPSNDPDENPVAADISGACAVLNSSPHADPDGPYTGSEGVPIMLDGSGSHDPDGTIEFYEWDVNNDGLYDYRSSSAVLNHAYPQQGIYSVRLRVTDNRGAVHEASTTASISDTSPAAAFTGSTGSGSAPLTVYFANESTGYDQPLTFEWDFDNDGTIDSTVRNPSVTYTEQGTYAVKLTAVDADGSSAVSIETGYITVMPAFYSLTVNGDNNGSLSSSPAGINCPGDCSAQYISGTVVTLTALPQPGYILQGWTGCDNSSMSQCTVTMNTDTAVTAHFVMSETTLGCFDGGNIECLERMDGGSDSDNLVNDRPKSNIGYEFLLTVTDSSGNKPQHVSVHLSNRSNPLPGDFHVSNMTCSGDYRTGALCSYVTQLAPAGVHKFYYEAVLSDRSTLRYPHTGYISGPDVRLLTGYNFVGLSRDINGDMLDGISSFDSSVVYRWIPDIKNYTEVTTEEPVQIGEGYCVLKQSETLPEHDDYADVSDAEIKHELRPGWNIISNPYPAAVMLSDVRIQKGNDIPVAWAEAASRGWIINAIYHYNGSDWGNTFSFETGHDAALIPWSGYWTYLDQADDTYYLVIPKPLSKADHEWQIHILAQVLNAENSIIIGQMPDASDEIDPGHDVPAFLTGDIKTYVAYDGQSYWKDMKKSCEISCSKTWNIVVESGVLGENTEISWNSLEVPDDINLNLRDMATGNIINMAAEEHIVYENTGRREFIVEVHIP